jgi:hypothetical protein
MKKADYVSTRIGNFDARINPRYDCAELRAALDKIHEFFLRPGTASIRDSRSTHAAIVPWDIGIGPETAFLKEARSRGAIYSIRHAIGENRVMRGFRAGIYLHSSGFPTPEPIAALVEKGLKGFVRAFYLAEAVTGAPTLAKFMGPDFQEMERNSKNAFIEALGSTLGRMHELGIEHRDLKSQNLLVKRTAAGGFEIIVTDLEGARFGKVGKGGAARDLGRLAYNFPQREFPWTDALRLIRTYREKRPALGMTWEQLIWSAQSEWRAFTRKYGLKK